MVDRPVDGRRKGYDEDNGIAHARRGLQPSRQGDERTHAQKIGKSYVMCQNSRQKDCQTVYYHVRSPHLVRFDSGQGPRNPDKDADGAAVNYYYKLGYKKAPKPKSTKAVDIIEEAEVQDLESFVNSLGIESANLRKHITDRLLGFDKIEEASKISMEMLNKSIRAFSKKDLKEANENINNVNDLLKKCDQIYTFALKQEAEVTISLGYMVESIRRIGEYAGDISEHVINYLIGEVK